MAIRGLVIWLLMLPGLVLGQTELQHKFKVSHPDTLMSVAQKLGGEGQVNSHNHSTWVYDDLYLDTESGDLLTAGYSLRFRRRRLDTDTTGASYSLQLKSEMAKLGAARKEIEDDELHIYKIWDGGQWLKLTDVLDAVFDNTNDLQRRQAIKLLTMWIEQKTHGPIAPFQQLPALSVNKMGYLKPVLVGSSVRKRSHLYVLSEGQPKAQLIPENWKARTSPEFFTLHIDYKWVGETSLDQSEFHFLTKDNVTPFQFSEFELENKMDDEEVGKAYLKSFETALSQHVTLTPELASKYKQSMEQLNKE